MAFSKTFLLLGLAFAVVLLVISSEVSARQLAEATQTQSAETNVEKTRYGTDNYGYGHGHGHGYGHGHGKGHGHGGHGKHGKPGHGGHPGHGAAEVENEDGEN